MRGAPPGGPRATSSCAPGPLLATLIVAVLGLTTAFSARGDLVLSLPPAVPLHVVGVTQASLPKSVHVQQSVIARSTVRSPSGAASSALTRRLLYASEQAHDSQREEGDPPGDPPPEGPPPGGPPPGVRELESRTSLRWVHIPKCGQSFAVTMYLWGCPDEVATRAAKFLTTSLSETKIKDAVEKWPPSAVCRSPQEGGIIPPIVDHFPAVPERDYSHLVYMMRDPIQRFESHWRHFRRVLPARREYEAEDRFYHSQLKMLLGSGFHDPVNVTRDMVDRAKQLVESRETAFVGLVEEWDLSVFLFHCMLLPHRPPIQEELMNIHKSDPKRSKGAAFFSSYQEFLDARERSKAAKATVYAHHEGISDPEEDEVYGVAKRRFAKDVGANQACISKMLDDAIANLRSDTVGKRIKERLLNERRDWLWFLKANTTSSP